MAVVDRLPPEVREAWVQQAPDECPGLAVDEASWQRCALGLVLFFEACRQQREHGPCALPSKAADSVWHVWLRLDPTGLAAWQRRCFGRELPHHTAQALGAPRDACLARTWAAACRSEGLGLLGPRLPLLFALDGELKLPTGWAYRFEGGCLVHQQIDGFGEPRGDRVLHATVAGAGLVTLGLMSEAELTAQRQRQAGGGGSGCGSSWDSGDGSCDAGGDAGSSCGSGCGGGGD